MKKRTFAIFLAASLGASILGGCSKGNEAGSPAVSAAPSATTQDQTDGKKQRIRHQPARRRDIRR